MCSKISKKNIMFASTLMEKNKIFPYVLTSNEKHATNATFTDDNWIWYHRYGRLSFKKLNLISEKDYVDGLPVIKNVNEIYEKCVVGKQHHNSFPKGQARKALKHA